MRGKRFSFDRFFVLKERRSMMAGFTSSVRSTHTGDAKELCSSSALMTPPSWNEMERWHSNIKMVLRSLEFPAATHLHETQMVLRSLDLPAATHLYETQGSMPNVHPVLMMRSSSGMSEMDHTSRIPADLKRPMELASAAEKDLSSESEVPSSKNSSEEGDPWQMTQWWRELLKALGLTVWVITGAVLVANVQNVAYTGFWARESEAKISPGHESGIPSGVLELSFLNFNETVKKRTTFVMFYAPWCPHCQRLHPVWEQLAAVLNKEGYDIQLAKVDATKHTRLAEKYEIVGYPSLIMFKRGRSVGRHRGPRDIDTLMSFVDSKNQ